MKIAALLGAITAAAVLGIGPAFAQTSLRIGYALAPDSHYGVAAKAFGDELARLTGNRFKVEHFPSSQLGGEREMIESLQLGTLDMAVTSTGPVSNFVPEVGITDIPFLFRDTAHARAVLDGPIGQEILSKFTARGIIALAWGEQGFRHLTNGRLPVQTPGDLKGLKLRTMENQVHMTAFRTLGANPTPMAWPEVIPGLRQGTIDGQENPISVITSARLFEVQKHLTLTRHVFSPAVIMLSSSVHAKLSDTDKQAFQQAAKVAQTAMRGFVDEVERRGVAELRAAGMQVVEGVDTAQFQQALAPAYAEYAKRYGQANIDRIRAYK